MILSFLNVNLQTDMDSTNIYAYISIIALFVCIPPAIIVSELLLHPLVLDGCTDLYNASDKFMFWSL